MGVPEGSERPHVDITVELLMDRLLNVAATAMPPKSRIVAVELDGKNGVVRFYFEPP